MIQPDGSGSAPHLVMLSGSHAQHDSRVRKSAATAARGGFRVTVLAPSPTAARFAEVVEADRDIGCGTGGGRWQLINVPVGRQERDRATRPRTLGRLGYASEQEASAAAERLTVGTGSLQGSRAKIVRLRTLILRYRQTRRIYRERWAQPALSLLLKVPSMSRWQRLVPESSDLDVALGPVVDELQPDLLQSHDVQTINVVAGAVDRAAAEGRRVPWIYDAHEHIAGLTGYPLDRLTGLVDLESSFIRRADAVLTVCEPIADHLYRHYGLRERPTVVLNAPPLADRGRAAVEPPGSRSLRADAGLGPEVPIVVYSGKVDADRGVGDLVTALPLLRPDVHVVLITNRLSGDTYLARLRADAEQRGCADRLHVVPYVLPEALVGYLSGATIGFAGFSHIGNHELALPNKFFDYLHAGVPMVVSDLELLGALVPELGVGQVYAFGDPAGLAAAVGRLLDGRDAYLAAVGDPRLLHRYCWQAQEPALLAVYGRLASFRPSTEAR